MSESWTVLSISFGLYAAVRALDEPKPWWRWPVLTGLVLGLAVTIRTAAIFVIPVVILSLLLCQSRSSEHWGGYWRAALAMLGVSAALLLAFATANATLGGRFGLGASPGWYLYGRVAHFADCNQFTPPPGRTALCEGRPPSGTAGHAGYISESRVACLRHFGQFGEHPGSPQVDEAGDPRSARGRLSNVLEYWPYWVGQCRRR